IVFNGNFTRQDLGTLINNGGGFGISGTLDLSGDELATDGTWYLTDDAMVKGGVLRDGTRIAVSYLLGRRGTLDGVTIDGTVSVGESVQLTITDGNINGHGIVLIGGTALEGPAVLKSGIATLTISKDMTVRGGGASFLGNDAPYISASRVENYGTLRSAVSGGSLDGGGFIFNHGAVAVDAGAKLTAGSMRFDTDSILSIAKPTSTSQAALSLVGTLDLSSLSDNLELTSPESWPLQVHYLIAHSASITGTFNHVTDNFAVQYTGTDIFVWRAFVPEPGVIGLVPAVAILRRRRRASGR
ncbi:MAG: hypothetical protein ACREJC_22880, partial [Tepidisphaeraceae bacterium]